MTPTNHLVPPPELVQQWMSEIWHEGTPVRVSLSDEHIAARAAQYGADRELEACCKAIRDRKWFADPNHRIAELRDARRPKPPSLKEQALQELEQLKGDANSMGMGFDAPAIRRALEALPND
jgi:hypothetical protein